MNTDCTFRSLCESPLFRGVDCTEFKDFCSKTRSRTYEKGEIIASEGKPCNSIGIISEGQVAIQKISSGGEFATIALLSSGDFFGEDIIYSSNSTYQTTLETMTHSKVRFVSKEVMNSIMATCPAVKDNFLRILSDRVNVQNRRIELLSQKTLREKIAYYLIDLFNQGNKDNGYISDSCKNCANFGQANCKYPSEARVVELPVSKEIVAKFLAMPRPSFSRELIAMEKDGLIKVNGRKITLCDVAKLETEIVEGLAANN
ncbi:MAG: Crp/Fnr family transcriptional regulator [Clostridiales bacterium]|nr:Crp/Fnr family transcriptional regulator [Clostridiales bacterium]